MQSSRGGPCRAIRGASKGALVICTCVKTKALSLIDRENRFRVSEVDAKMTAASINSRRIQGLIMTVALLKSRILSKILPLRGNPSRSEGGDVSPPPIGPRINGGPRDPRKVGTRNPAQVR